MKVQAKPTENEMSLYEVLRHPVFCGEFIRELDTDKDWVYDYYQEEMLCDGNPYVGICTGRSVGKTTALEDIVVRHVTNMFFDAMMFNVPNQVHIDPTFLRLMSLYKTNSFLQNYVYPRKSFNSQKYNIIFKNGFLFDGRIAGTSGGEQNVAGAHYPIVIVDEGGLYPWGTWVHLQPCLNSFEAGAQMIVAGVPTGLRDGNVLYLVDALSKQFTKHNVSAHQNPRYTKADDQRNKDQFGGEGSEDYKHIVKGEHGSPVYSVFDRSQMLIEDYRYPVITLTRKDHKDSINTIYLDLNALPIFPEYAQATVIGIDWGYTEPTVIIPMYLASGKWRILYRLTLYQCKSPVQREILSFLRTRLQPDFIGIDEGHGGRAFVQEISEQNPNLFDLLVPINFGSNIPVGYDEDGKEINVRAKQFGVQRLQQMTNSHEVAYSKYDEYLILELERTTYTKSPSGILTYTTMTERGGMRGGDHNLAALLGAVVALYLKLEFASAPKRVPLRKLLRPGWLMR